jgi:hypothetical protein
MCILTKKQNNNNNNNNNKHQDFGGCNLWRRSTAIPMGISDSPQLHRIRPRQQQRCQCQRKCQCFNGQWEYTSIKQPSTQCQWWRSCLREIYINIYFPTTLYCTCVCVCDRSWFFLSTFWLFASHIYIYQFHLRVFFFYMLVFLLFFFLPHNVLLCPRSSCAFRSPFYILFFTKPSHSCQLLLLAAPNFILLHLGLLGQLQLLRLS